MWTIRSLALAVLTRQSLSVRIKRDIRGFFEGVDQLYEEVSVRGAEVISQPTTEPWGLREFSIRTPDGHRIRFGEPIGTPG